MSKSLAVLAGRRIDSPGAGIKRFPLSNSNNVKKHLVRTFEKWSTEHLVCSAACGADLIALEVADELRIPYTIVLPFALDHFCRVSVVDRPGDWAQIFHLVTKRAQERGSLVILSGDESDQSYTEANTEIVRRALDKKKSNPNDVLVSIVVWEGVSRGDNDHTAEFQDLSRAAGMSISEISTL